MTPKMP